MPGHSPRISVSRIAFRRAFPGHSGSFAHFGIVSANPALARKLLPTFPFGVLMTYSTGIVWNETHRVMRTVKPPPTSHANELFTLPASEARTLPMPAKMKGVYLDLLPNACSGPKVVPWTFLPLP